MIAEKIIGAKKFDLAKYYGREIAELERRGDFGGLHIQARNNLKDVIFQGYNLDKKPEWLLPSGRVTNRYVEAEAAWNID